MSDEVIGESDRLELIAPFLLVHYPEGEHIPDAYTLNSVSRYEQAWLFSDPMRVRVRLKEPAYIDATAEMLDGLRKRGATLEPFDGFMEKGQAWKSDKTGNTVTTARFYHVADRLWEPGNPLMCWNRLKSLGIPVEWKWDEVDEAPVGNDGDVVCLFATRGEAEWWQADLLHRHHKGTIVAVDIPDEVGERERPYNLPNGEEVLPRMVRVQEGYVACVDAVPAEWLVAIG